MSAQDLLDQIAAIADEEDIDVALIYDRDEGWTVAVGIDYGSAFEKDTPEQVAGQLTEMREDMARTFDGVPIWTAPAMDAEGRMVIMVLTVGGA